MPEMYIPELLKQVNVGAIYQNNTKGELLLLLKLSPDIPFTSTTPISFGTLEWYQYKPEGVVVRTLVQVFEDL